MSAMHVRIDDAALAQARAATTAAHCAKDLVTLCLLRFILTSFKFSFGLLIFLAYLYYARKLPNSRPLIASMEYFVCMNGNCINL